MNLNTDSHQDIADKLSKLDEKDEIKPLEIIGRTAVYVFYSSYKHVRQLTRFGNLAYSSKKARYALLYVNTDELEQILPALDKLHFVKQVKVSELDNLNLDFAAAFQETVSDNQKIAEA
ncbi:UPF0298 protein YdgE [Lactococcus insecticola]|uniref:UPF0298 protein YdgE n=2 Tax=Pseudolactococcus insecticola TaxID=2709158 RepID=A0A6A0B8W3_9LACT|nr:UPF0298 protein YdgE [Lactococcus insecticola]